MTRNIRVIFLTAIFLFSLTGVLRGQSNFYWEEIELFSPRAGSFPVSAYSKNLSAVAWQELTPNRDTSIAADGLINVCLAVKEPKGKWEQRGIIAGPYAYIGNEPSILSMIIDRRDRIIITAAASGSRTEILISQDGGKTFARNLLNMETGDAVAPRIFCRADGGYLLFHNRSSSQSLAIHYSRSDDAVAWSPFELFNRENNLSLSFLPAHASVGRKDIVFYQTMITDAESSSSFQLYYKTSEDSGRTWSAAKRFTVFNDPVTQTRAPPDRFDNQRAWLVNDGNNLFLTWERRYIAQQPQIYCASLDSNINIIGAVERVNNEDAYCNNPIGFIYENKPTVVWFDNRRGNNRIILAQRDYISWQNHQLSSTSSEASFARPVVDNDGVFIFWQSALRETSRVYMLAPDHSVESPKITAVNFNSSVPNRSERARLSWNVPNDTSGILGFSWTWSQNRNLDPPKNINFYNSAGNTNSQDIELTADRDGVWYFKVMAQDFAGNWSGSQTIEYIKKSTPPPKVSVIPLELDQNGFTLSNNFNFRWEPVNAPYVAGYTWDLQYLGEDFDNHAVTEPPPSIMGTGTSASYRNQDNGFWAFTVSAVDMAGNIGESSNLFFKADKFIPYTGVSYIDAEQDEQGILSIKLYGRGFTTDGGITNIVLERGGEKISSEFTIESDREISGLRFENLDEGQYQIKLEHSSRGWYTAEQTLNIQVTGTVKFGDYSRQWKPSWVLSQRRKFEINFVYVLAALLIIFGVLGTGIALRGIAGVAAESIAVKKEMIAIITGDFMPIEKKRKIVKIKFNRRGLRYKLASFTLVLVISVVVMISTPLYLYIMNTQRATLEQGLWDRCKVLLEGLASSSKAYLPAGNVLELGFLPAQSEAIPDAYYVTITGYTSGSIYNDHVWATNDPDILTKIDTVNFRPGVSRINDNLSPYLEMLNSELNAAAQAEIGENSRQITALTQEGIALINRTDAQGVQRLNDIQVTISSLETRLKDKLSEISGEIRSYPEYTPENINKNKINNYIFYKPILFRQSTEENYVRGFVRLEVTTDIIMDQIQREQTILLRTILIYAAIAIAIGAIGALVLAALIIKPIRELVKHIEIIRDTEDKVKLSGHEIQIKSKDEIAILGNTINDMTHGLVKAAAAASDLSIGKEIQKKFIPLDLDKYGNKKSSGFKETDTANFFGYYEGAKGVSGDYFDYIGLDGRYYAIIKCDVAGKGIPAALIMIQVATMFLNYFKQWKPNAKGMHIEDVVYQINEFIETLAFKGRFAAFTLCLYDSKTGVIRFCNAGDNIVRLYDASEGRMKIITLPESPAAGVLPNFMIENTGGYKVQTLTIDKGDILLLYTDGIEEAKRKFRNSEFKEIICTKGPVDTPHENHTCGQGDEELGPERVEAIINAVMAKGTYNLHKHHNPEDGQELQFDFSSCQGHVEDVIMAMVSVEKMFRCYKDPKNTEDSKVLVDKKVDEFLKNHFIQYRNYCAYTREFPENDAYMYYTQVSEDEQYDDLTILGIKRKN